MTGLIDPHGRAGIPDNLQSRFILGRRRRLRRHGITKSRFESDGLTLVRPAIGGLRRPCIGNVLTDDFQSNLLGAQPL
jgi:hypothetical protein